MPIIFVMQGKCLFLDISRPEMSCDSQCSVALPHKAMSWSAMYDINSFFISSFLFFKDVQCEYSKTCLKRPLKNRQNSGLKGRW